MGELHTFIANVEREIINPIITLIALAAFVVFIWGVVDFIRGNATGGEKIEDGKRHMIWGIVGLAIIFGAQAILHLIGATVAR